MEHQEYTNTITTNAAAYADGTIRVPEFPGVRVDSSPPPAAAHRRCPFCGMPPDPELSCHDGAVMIYWVVCSSGFDHCIGGPSRPTADEAWEAWDTRPDANTTVHVTGLGTVRMPRTDALRLLVDDIEAAFTTDRLELLSLEHGTVDDIDRYEARKWAGTLMEPFKARLAALVGQ